MKRKPVQLELFPGDPAFRKFQFDKPKDWRERDWNAINSRFPEGAPIVRKPARQSRSNP